MPDPAKLQADGLTTVDQELAAKAEGVMPVAPVADFLTRHTTWALQRGAREPIPGESQGATQRRGPGCHPAAVQDADRSAPTTTTWSRGISCRARLASSGRGPLHQPG